MDGKGAEAYRSAKGQNRKKQKLRKDLQLPNQTVFDPSQAANRNLV